ncbi:hypothetical protein WDV93_10295 [Pantoea ananatis]
MQNEQQEFTPLCRHVSLPEKPVSSESTDVNRGNDLRQHSTTLMDDKGNPHELGTSSLAL